MRRALLALISCCLFAVASMPATAVTNTPSPLSQEANTGIGAVTSLLSGIDATLTDTAVTATDLAAAGGIDNSLPTLVDSPGMLIVDDDKVECPNAQFTRISDAVLAAAPGATIRICPGIYRESVLVDKPLTLQAPRHQGEATECTTPTADDPTQEAIVQYGTAFNGGSPSEGFDVESSGVTIDGLKIEPDPLQITHDGIGIFTSAAFAGYTITHNVLQNNTFGMYFNSSGAAESTAQANCMRNNNLPGAAGGNGIYEDMGLVNAQITNNYFTGDQNAAIVLETATPNAMHDVTVTHNSSVNDGTIVTFATAGPTAYNLTVDYNKVVGSSSSGIVTFNVRDSEYAYNDVENSTNNGISLHLTTNSTVGHNRVSGSKMTGIRIADDSTSNTVSNNRSENNLQAGLAAHDNSINNTISQNHMDGNAPDCYDETHGPGTSGTGNYWIGDFGLTEFPAGICKHAGP